MRRKRKGKERSGNNGGGGCEEKVTYLRLFSSADESAGHSEDWRGLEHSRQTPQQVGSMSTR